LIVADSSYIVDALLGENVGFGTEGMIAPELAVYEVANAVLVRERILRLSGTGQKYLAALFQAIDASLLEIIHASASLVEEAHEIAVRNQAALYDCVFVALCLRSGLSLKTRDGAQLSILEKEKARRGSSLPTE